MPKPRLGRSSLIKPGESLWCAFDRYILAQRAKMEKLSAELKWHEDRIEVYDLKTQERFKRMREILDGE